MKKPIVLTFRRMVEQLTSFHCCSSTVETFPSVKM